MSAQSDLFAPSYWNTTALRGADLNDAQAAAALQDTQVLSVFRQYGPTLSPSQVWLKLHESCGHILLTSVRRSITTLTTAGRLRKLDEKRRGYYSRVEHLWQLS